jgi:hypothetical protein
MIDNITADDVYDSITEMLNLVENSNIKHKRVAILLLLYIRNFHMYELRDDIIEYGQRS